MVQYGRSSRSSWAKSVWSSFGKTVMGKAIWEKSYWSTVGKRFPIGNASLCIVKGLFLSVYVDDITLAGKKQNINPMWKLLNKEVDLGEPTSFLDHVYLGCSQRECEISNKLCWNAKFWHVLEDLIFYGQWMNLHDRSQNGPKAFDKRLCRLISTFIIHVITNSIVMWETLLQTGTISRLKFCGRSWGLKIYIKWNIVLFLETIHLFW